MKKSIVKLLLQLSSSTSNNKMNKWQKEVVTDDYTWTWNVELQACISQILNGFDTNFSRIPTSQSIISPLLQPTVKERIQVKQWKIIDINYHW